MSREKGMLSSLTKIKINLIASLLHWHDSCCESSNQKGKLILQLLIKWYLCAPSYYSRSKNNYYFGEFVHTIFHRMFLLERASLLHLHLELQASPGDMQPEKIVCYIVWSPRKNCSSKSKVYFKLNSPSGIWLASMKLPSHTKKG